MEFIVNLYRKSKGGIFMSGKKMLLAGLSLATASMAILSGGAFAETTDSSKGKKLKKQQVINLLENNDKEDSYLYIALGKDDQDYEGAHNYLKNENFKRNFKVIGEELSNYQKDNPDATEEELNEFFIETAKKYSKEGSEKRIAKSDGEYELEDYDIPKLNEYEEVLFDDNPKKGYWSIAAGVEAYDYTDYLFGSTKWPGGKNDAFRHAYWNITMVMLVNDQWADDWATAHELGAADYSKNNPHVKMDLHNNDEGRYKAAQDGLDPNDHFTDARKSAHELYEGGKLKYLKNWDKYPRDWNKLDLTRFTGKSSDYENDPRY